MVLDTMVVALVIVGFIACIILAKSVYLIQQAEAMVIERFGEYSCYVTSWLAYDYAIY